VLEQRHDAGAATNQHQLRYGQFNDMSRLDLDRLSLNRGNLYGRLHNELQNDVEKRCF
jgi:hypothetical protein